MPGLNQSGPMGQGAMTGRQMGKCTNFGEKVKDQPAPAENQAETPIRYRMGFGGGQGRGRGQGRRSLGRGAGMRFNRGQ
ncbi:MAG: DUF5320 domain-containing protein [Salinivirgaceae bacterium]